MPTTTESWIPVHLYGLLPASSRAAADPWSAANRPLRDLVRDDVYEVSTHGRVRVAATGRILRPLTRMGRVVVRLPLLPPAESRDPLAVDRRPGPREVSVARLVLASWRSFPQAVPSVADVVAHHVSGDRSDCSLGNLVWLTRSESQRRHAQMRASAPKK